MSAASPAATDRLAHPVDTLTAVLQHARVAGSHPAAKDDAVELDYAQLRSEAAALAAGLLARGVEPGDRVALELPNSVEFLVAALGCLWVGAIFVPLAVSDPRARLDSIIDDCNPRLVLTTPDREDPHPLSATVAAVRIDGAEPPVADPAGLAAYAIYTSGTTGTPKGVIIGRTAFAVAVGQTVRSLGMDQSTRALCVSPFHFDGSFGTLFPAVVAGAALVIPPRDALLFARYFFRKLTSENITHTGFSSTYLRLLLASPHLAAFTTTPDLTVALGGEVCSVADVARLWETKPNTRVFNRYGPTETTIAVTHFEVTRDVIDRGGPVPIGRPHPDTIFYLIDAAGAVVDTDETVGELYIGGPQVMEYYWNAPALTAEVIDTSTVAGERLYRSGDLMRRSANGDYIYVDRVNRVIKRNAVRISLIELTEALCTLPDVTAAVCSTFDNAGELGIVAFVVSSGTDSPQNVRVAAAQAIPASMLPDSFVLIDALPLTSSSKVDERRLLADAGLAPH